MAVARLASTTSNFRDPVIMHVVFTPRDSFLSNVKVKAGFFSYIFFSFWLLHVAVNATHPSLRIPQNVYSRLGHSCFSLVQPQKVQMTGLVSEDKGGRGASQDGALQNIWLLPSEWGARKKRERGRERGGLLFFHHRLFCPSSSHRWPPPHTPLFQYLMGHLSRPLPAAN